MGLLGRFFGTPKPPAKTSSITNTGAGQTIETVAEVIAQRIATTFSFARFSEMFRNESLSVGWSRNDALAAWYSLGNLALVNAVWHEYTGSPHRANQMIDLVRPKLLNQWKMPEATLDRLLSVVGKTEEQALRSFNACANGTELETFFSRYASLILGAPVPFSNRSILEEELMGIENKGTNPIKNAALSMIFIEICVEIKQYLKNVPIEWEQTGKEGSEADVQKELSPKGSSQKMDECDFDKSDYGPASMAPSKEAQVISDLMSTDEKKNFHDLLVRLQQWHEQIAGELGIVFHPEARACLWGLSLAKLAEHYRETHLTERALFFMDAAWILSKYPVFANNAALLSIAMGDIARAKNLLQSFLSNYKAVPGTQTFRLIEDQITLDELEVIAISARARLAAIESGTNPMII